MTIRVEPIHEHAYVCTLTRNVCMLCGHVEGTPDSAGEGI